MNWTADQRARARTKLPALYDAAERAKDILEGFVNEGLWTSTAKIDEVVHDITDIINEIDTGGSDG